MYCWKFFQARLCESQQILQTLLKIRANMLLKFCKKSKIIRRTQCAYFDFSWGSFNDLALSLTSVQSVVKSKVILQARLNTQCYNGI